MWNMSDQTPYQRTVSFGDCDPAGIVYYPNILAWVDGAFHHHLRGFGGHAALCARLGATGMGAVDVTCQFKRPLRDGDTVEVHLTGLDWSGKTFVLHYEGRTKEGLHFSAQETRGIFLAGPKGLTLAPTKPLQDLLERGDG